MTLLQKYVLSRDDFINGNGTSRVVLSPLQIWLNSNFPDYLVLLRYFAFAYTRLFSSAMNMNPTVLLQSSLTRKVATQNIAQRYVTFQI